MKVATSLDFRVDVELKHRLRNVETDRCDCVPDGSPESREQNPEDHLKLVANQRDVVSTLCMLFIEATPPRFVIEANAFMAA
jgi:hypothetical protein